jgi:tetratricopeptide (TPR) repeat protein
MRPVLSIPAICLLAAALGVPAFGERDSFVEAPVISCGNGVPGGITCIASKKGLKEARTSYAHGLKFHGHGQLDEALAQFNNASRLAPQDVKFLSAREVTKAQLVFQHTERGDKFLADAQREPAAAEYREALLLDPENSYTQQRLAEAMRDQTAYTLAGLTASLADSTEIHLQPKAELATFHYRGDVRGLFTELASAYGVQAQFDDSVAAKTVRFYVDDVDFSTALSLACLTSKAMWTPLDAHQFLIAADSKENHKQYDRMSLGTFAVPGANTPQEVTELVTSLRNI